jgi:hypothetical protein
MDTVQPSRGRVVRYADYVLTSLQECWREVVLRTALAEPF